MKKIISVLLSLIMLFALCVPAFSADAQQENCPVIYIEGQGIGIIRNQGQEGEQKLYPFDEEILPVIFNNIKPLLKEAALGVVKNDYSEYTNMIKSLFEEKYSELKLGKDGYPTDGSVIYKHNMWQAPGKLSNIRKTIPVTNGTYPVYRWHYDWRLSPLELAKDLDKLIDTVLAQTGAQKVNIISRCQGTCIAYAYLAEESFGALNKVNSCVFYDSAFLGIGMVNALFSGEIKLNAGAVDRFLSYYMNENNMVINDEETTKLILSLAELFEEVEVLGFGLDKLEPLVQKIAADAAPAVLKESFGTFPSYWAMLSPEYFEKAINFVFPTDEEKAEWAGLIDQLKAYHELQKDAAEIITELSKTVDIAFVSKYGFPAYPISADAAEDGDGYVSARLTGFGAKVTDLDKKFSTSYLNKARLNGFDKYISADGKIDASKGVLPDKTWYIKNLYHTPFPDCVNDLMVKFINSDGTMTVWSDPQFTQFLNFTPTNNESSDASRGVLNPILEAGDTNDTTKDYTQSPLQALFRFLQRLISVLLNLFVTQK